MIPLDRKGFPSSKDELTRALDEAFHHLVRKEGPIAGIYCRVFPYLDEIVINVDGAQLDSLPQARPRIVNESRPACEAAIVTLSGRNISVQGVPLNFRMEARDIVFHQGSDENGQCVLMMHTVRDGSVVISATQLDLERAIEQIARREGDKNGIAIEQARLAIWARGERSLTVDIRLQARKFFLRADIDISSQLDIDENFIAKISNLKCKSNGAVGSVACGALDPVFRRLEGKTFSLTSLPLGEIQLRDVHIAVADTIEITADFGTGQS
jgi:hypothetical protein